MNNKFTWTIKHTIFYCLFCVLLLVALLFQNNNKLINFSVSLLCCSIGLLAAHIIRIKRNVKNNEIPLSKKQMLLVFSLLGLMILSIFLIKEFVADESLEIILICSLALVSGIFALFYVLRCIKKNKLKENDGC